MKKHPELFSQTLDKMLFEHSGIYRKKILSCDHKT